MDPELVKQFNNVHARGVIADAGFQAGVTNGMNQLSYLVASGNAFDTRLMNGFLSAQLFNTDVVQAKTAYHSPVEPAAAPLPSPVAK